MRRMLNALFGALLAVMGTCALWAGGELLLSSGELHANVRTTPSICSDTSLVDATHDGRKDHADAADEPAQQLMGAAEIDRLEAGPDHLIAKTRH